jgi:hypothetical protein
MADIDISKLTLDEILAMAEAKKQQIAQTKIEKSAEALKFIEDTLKKKYNGLTLEDLGFVKKAEVKVETAREYKVSYYKNPADGTVYKYKGFGAIAADVKTWLIKDDKRNEGYRHKDAQGRLIDDKGVLIDDKGKPLAPVLVAAE